MQTPCLVRQVRLDDFADLVQNYYGCYDERDAGEYVGILLFPQKPSMEEEKVWFQRLYARTQDGSEVACVAEVDGHAVGYCGVARRGPAGFETAHVGDLGILLRRSHRGRGIGRALMSEALRRCVGTFDVVVLSVFTDNGPAKALYRRLGFERYGTLPGAVKRGGVPLDSDEMFLRLPAGRAPSGAAAPQA